MKGALKEQVRHVIGTQFAAPDVIHVGAEACPRPGAGKIMRRILRKVAANELENLGDTSTLAEPAVVDDIIENRAVK